MAYFLLSYSLSYSTKHNSSSCVRTLELVWNDAWKDNRLNLKMLAQDALVNDRAVACLQDGYKALVVVCSQAPNFAKLLICDTKG